MCFRLHAPHLQVLKPGATYAFQVVPVKSISHQEIDDLKSLPISVSGCHTPRLLFVSRTHPRFRTSPSLSTVDVGSGHLVQMYRARIPPQGGHTNTMDAYIGDIGCDMSSSPGAGQTVHQFIPTTTCAAGCYCVSYSVNTTAECDSHRNHRRYHKDHLVTTWPTQR